LLFPGDSDNLTQLHPTRKQEEMVSGVISAIPVLIDAENAEKLPSPVRKEKKNRTGTLVDP